MRRKGSEPKTLTITIPPGFKREAERAARLVGESLSAFLVKSANERRRRIARELIVQTTTASGERE